MRSHPIDPIHLLTRKEQTIVSRLQTGHNRKKQHIYAQKVDDREIWLWAGLSKHSTHARKKKDEEEENYGRREGGGGGG